MRRLLLIALLAAPLTARADGEAVSSLPQVAEGTLFSQCNTLNDGTIVANGQGNVEIRLVGVDMGRSWRRLCARIVQAAHVQDPPFDGRTIQLFHEHLMRLGYFEAARCSLDKTQKRLSCDVTQRKMVYSNSVSGDLPFAILKSDVKQRLYLRPGALLDDQNENLDKQSQRVRDYLQDAGYFDSEVDLVTTPEDGAEPNAGVHVDARVSHGKKYRIGKIDITGTKLLSEDDARDYLTHYWLPFVRIHFQPLTFTDDLERMARKLQRRGWPQARVKGSYELDDTSGLAHITLDIDSGPIVRVAFIGNHAIDDDDLLDESTFEDSQSVDSGTVEDMADKIREHYQRDGYYDARVEGSLRSVSKIVAQATFEIVEGPNAKLTRIVFTGNDTFDQKWLEKSTGLLLTSSKRWVYSYSDHDIAVLRDFYFKQGFANAQVATSITPIAEGELELTFAIAEGPRRTIESVTLKGLPDSPNAQIASKRLESRTGQPFVAEQAEDDKRMLSALLAADGYPRAEVEQEIDGPEAEVGGSMRIAYRVNPNDRSRYGGLLLRGDFRTRRSLIEQELGLEKGDPLDVTAVGAATRRLRSLGIFSSVQLTALDDYAGGETWMLAALQERPAVRLDGTVSFSTNDAFQVGGDFTDRNVLGRGIQFTLRLRWGNANQAIGFLPAIGNMDEAVATLRAPRPLGLPFDVIYRASYVYEDRSRYDEVLGSTNDLDPAIDRSNLGDYDERRVRAAVGLVRTLLERGKCLLCPLIVGSLNYEVSGVTTWFSDGRITANFGRIYPLLSFDARDSATDPRRGYYAEGRIELAERFMGLMLENPQAFWRFVSRLSIFVPLGSPLKRPHPKDDIAIGGPLVLAMSGTYGVGAPLGANPDTCNNSGQQRCELPPSEVFAYGGDFSLRGLRLRESFDAVNDARTIFNGTAELRWYMIENLGFGTLQIAAFMDYGSVATKDGTLFADATISVGPALRYVTPVGPLSVAYGRVVQLSPQLRRFDQEQGDASPTGRFVIGFGYTF